MSSGADRFGVTGIAGFPGGTLLEVGPWLEFLDLPFWGLAAVSAFRVSAAFRGGALGRATGWVGWALVLVVGGKLGRGALLFFDQEGFLSSEPGQLSWGALLTVAWCLAGLGLYEFHRAGRSI